MQQGCRCQSPGLTTAGLWWQVAAHADQVVNREVEPGRGVDPEYKLRDRDGQYQSHQPERRHRPGGREVHKGPELRQIQGLSMPEAKDRQQLVDAIALVVANKGELPRGYIEGAADADGFCFGACLEVKDAGLWNGADDSVVNQHEVDENIACS